MLLSYYYNKKSNTTKLFDRGLPCFWDGMIVTCIWRGLYSFEVFSFEETYCALSQAIDLLPKILQYSVVAKCEILYTIDNHMLVTGVA